MLAGYVGVSILLTYLRFAQWYDLARQLGISNIPFFLGYGESVIRGALLALFVSVCIFMIFDKLQDTAKCGSVRSAVWIFALYSLATGFSILVQPHAYDPGLTILLMVPGFSAIASTFLWAGNVALEREPQILDKDIMFKWIELEHKETIEAITTLTLVVISSIVVLMYTSLHGWLGAIYQDMTKPNPIIVWQIYGMAILDYAFAAAGLAIFTMAPLFLKLDILKAKLIGMQTQTPSSSRRRRAH